MISSSHLHQKCSNECCPTQSWSQSDCDLSCVGLLSEFPWEVYVGLQDRVGCAVMIMYICACHWLTSSAVGRWPSALLPSSPLQKAGIAFGFTAHVFKAVSVLLPCITDCICLHQWFLCKWNKSVPWRKNPPLIFYFHSSWDEWIPKVVVLSNSYSLDLLPVVMLVCSVYNSSCRQLWQ